MWDKHSRDIRHRDAQPSEPCIRQNRLSFFTRKKLSHSWIERSQSYDEQGLPGSGKVLGAGFSSGSVR
jgi:hypothetical protein